MRAKKLNLGKFSLKYAEIDGFTQIILKDEHSMSVLSCIPGIDAMISELSLTHRNDQVNLIKSVKNEPDLSKARREYAGVILFPFPNRLCDGRYSHNGKDYSFPVNDTSGNHNLHGKNNNQYKLANVDLEAGIIHLEYDHVSDFAPYPFVVRVSVKYQLSEKGLNVQIAVKNHDSIKIPLGLGAHPYFNFNCAVDDLLLEIPSRQFVQLTTDLIPTGEFGNDDTFSKMRKIGDTEFDTCFVLDERDVCSIYCPANDLHFHLRQDRKELAYLQIYIPAERDRIAIEPVSCIPDAFNNGIGLVELEAGESCTANFVISID